MIRFQIEGKDLTIFDNDIQIQNIHLITSTITNKFFIVTNFIENTSKCCGSEFDNWFKEFLKDYFSEIEKYPVIEKNIDNIKFYVNKYLDSRGIDLGYFVDESKAKKNTILFTIDEIDKIIKLSCYLKIYSLIFNSTLKLDQRLHRKIYNELAKDVLNSNIVNKIFNIIKTKTFRYNLTDKYMWDYIKMVQCKTIDVHIIEIFNFIMNSILILCEEDRNPITYFVSVIQESINWFLRSVYKGQIVYEDSISTEDIHGSTVDNLKTYSYNDTLGRLKGIAFEKIYDNIERSSVLLFSTPDIFDKNIVTFQNRLSEIKFISPLCDSLVYPILCKITCIPYLHFKTLSPDHSVVLSIYLQMILRKVFKLTEYKNLFSLLSYFLNKEIPIVTTYKIKMLDEFIQIAQETNNFFGFKSKKLFGDMLGYFVGRISRANFINVFDGRELPGVPLSKIEKEMIKFYTLFFANEFDSKIKEMKKLMSIDF